MNPIGWCDKTVNYSYIAGFFDGEGCITILTIKLKNRFQLRPKIDLTQKKQEILHIIKKKLGYGYIYKTKENISKLLICSYKDLNNFINNVGKYIIIKKEQIDLLKLFLNKCSDSRSCPYSQIELSFLLDIRDKIHLLNKPAIELKYSKNEVLKSNDLNLDEWKEKRKKNMSKINNKFIKKNIPIEEINKYLELGYSIRKISRIFKVDHTAIMRRIKYAKI